MVVWMVVGEVVVGVWMGQTWWDLQTKPTFWQRVHHRHHRVNVHHNDGVYVDAVCQRAFLHVFCGRHAGSYS
jgi:hypothetical protein